MDGWTIGADVGVMLTGLSVLTATSVWTRNQWREFRERRAAARLRNWHAYVMPERINEWYVRLAEDPETPVGTVVLEVLASLDGEPDPALAQSMRQVVLADGMLARAPTPEEYDFLKAQRKARRDSGFPVVSDDGALTIKRHRQRQRVPTPGCPPDRRRSCRGSSQSRVCACVAGDAEAAGRSALDWEFSRRQDCPAREDRPAALAGAVTGGA
jgi:hypothetical protein